MIVAVIGTGFCGAAVAAHILRSRAQVRVLLIGRSHPPGRGVAYGARLDAHLLNVPVGKMSLFQDDPDHFLRYARERDLHVTADSFVPRRLFGEYVGAVLSEAQRSGDGSATLEVLDGDAVGIQGTTIELAKGSPVRADRIVLAPGNLPSPSPEVPDASFYLSDRYVRVPWASGALDGVRPGDRVLLVGTGLTMMDVALELIQRGVTPPLNAISRRGALPFSHDLSRARAAGLRAAPSFDEARPTIAGYFRSMRQSVEENASEGVDWRVVIDSIRGSTPRLWQALPVEERARFLRHVRPHWEIHRHRAPPETAAAIAALVDAGRLKIEAARIAELRPSPAGVSAVLRPRGLAQTVELDVERVVNCTGPDTDVRRTSDPLVRSLLARGQIRPDPLGLGVDTTADGTVVERDGRPSPRISLIGPLRKGSFWECTAVPELRVHAAELAARLVGSG